MFIHNDIFTWDGWGGAIRLAAGKCHLWLFDLRRIPKRPAGTVFMQPFIGVVMEIDPDNPISLRSVTSHIATRVTQKFHIDPRRLLWVEYAPAHTYGRNQTRSVPAKLDAVEMQWVDGKALIPKWRPLEEPLRSLVLDLIAPPA